MGTTAHCCAPAPLPRPRAPVRVLGCATAADMAAPPDAVQKAAAAAAPDDAEVAAVAARVRACAYDLSYWQQRYTKERATFEWYTSLSAATQDTEASPFLQARADARTHLLHSEHTLRLVR